MSAEKAFAEISQGLTSVRQSDGASVPTATLYSYSNSAYGAIQSDGSVKLSYTDVPVWLFTEKLTSYIPGPGAYSSGASVPTKQPSDCSYYYVVLAKDASLLTSGEECAKGN